MSQTTKVDVYQLSSTNGQVKLNVTIGYAQNAVSSIFLNNIQIKSEDPSGNFIRSFSKDLGTNNELDQKNLILNTIVHDIQPNTDMTNVTIEITGGVNNYKLSMEEAAPNTGGTVIYTLNLFFYL